MTDETVRFRADEHEEQAIGHYRILRRLARGGMGEVFLAEDTRLRRKAAVKVISPESASDPTQKRRFLREAHAASALNHPNIAVIYDVGETPDGVSFIGMEYVEGETLASVMRQELPFRRLLDYAIEIAGAAAEAHRHGIIHRDLKPQNVMITTRQSVKVLDFGLAKRSSDSLATAPDSVITASGMVMGTLPYMSPEQARGQELDHRSDIFSIGVILYQMATRELPFNGNSVFDTLERIVRSEPEPISRRNPSAPAEFIRIVSTCLKKPADQRYASADDLLTDLKSLSSRIAANASIPTAATQSRRWTSIAVAAILIVGAAAATLFSIARGRDSAPATRVAAAATAPSATRSKAVAVLPFKSLSADPGSESFSEGMTEEIINALANIDGLRVASRTSSFAFKGASVDIRTVAEKLRVGSVVEGSVRKAGDQIRVTVQLVGAEDGYQVWSETFDRKLTDVFAIQDEIARTVARRVGGVSAAAPTVPPTANLDAYRAFVMGRYLVRKGSVATLREAIDVLQTALRLDPNFALANVELANAWRLLVARTGVAPDDGYPRAIAAAEAALRSNPRLDSAHAALAAISSSQMRWRDAERHIAQAIALNADSPEAYRSRSALMLNLGRFDEAVQAATKSHELAADPTNIGRTLYSSRSFPGALSWFQKALEANPESPVVHYYMGMTLAQLRRFPEAAASMNKAIELSGDQRWRTHLAHIHALAGQRAEADALINDVIAKTDPKDYPRPDFAAVYALLGDKERALTWLETAYEIKPSDLASIKSEPDLITLQSEPRYQALLKRMGL
jgi:serine/threonine-protein kinase